MTNVKCQKLVYRGPIMSKYKIKVALFHQGGYYIVQFLA